jgi:hypothetical protein
VKNKKELIKEREDKKLFGTINPVNTEQERIEKLKKIDNFIKENLDFEKKNLVSNSFESLNLNKEVNTRVNNSQCIVSMVIEEYIDSEARNKSLVFRNKIAKLEKEKHFEEDKGEYSELVRKVFIKYVNLHKKIDNYFNQTCKHFPGFGELCVC